MAQLSQSKKGFWENFKSEFSKIVWPTREQTIKKTIVVLVISIVLTLLVLCFDNISKYVVTQIL